jgi:hypothetical protein
MEDLRNYGGWIQTYSGGIFHPLDPRAPELSIFDIAHSAALTCRWTGHVRFHFSLAQHQVLASLLVEEKAREKGLRRIQQMEVALWALLHDGSESYIADIARPVKVKMPQYYEIEGPIMNTITDHWDLPRQMPPLVKWADDVLLCTEARDLLRPCVQQWVVGKDMPKARLQARLRPWPQWYAEWRFLDRYTELTGEKTLWTFLKNKAADIASLVYQPYHDPAALAAAEAKA